MYPHLQVREVIDPKAIPFLRGSEGYRPAATLSFHPSRQAKRAVEREMDKAKRRAEDWYKRHCSAEPILIGSFPSYAATSTKSFPLVGAFPPGQEARELQVVFEGTLKINVGTGQIQAADHNVVALAILSKLRFSAWGQNDVLNLFPAEVRTVDYIADVRDPFIQDPQMKIGQALTTTAFNFKLKMKIPFCFRGLEVPEIYSPTSDQLNLPATKVDLDTNGAALATVGLASGAGTITISDVKLYLVANQVPLLHVGPPLVYRSRAISQSIDTDFGQGCDIIVSAEEAATGAAGGARVAQWTVRRDGRPQPLNIDPVTLGAQFMECEFTADVFGPLDPTIGSIPYAGVATSAQPVPYASIGTQQGAVNTMLLFNDGRVRSGAWQWPYYTTSRQLYQNLGAGQSPSVTILYVQARPIYEAQGQIVNLANANGIAISSVDQLKVRGGNDGEVNKLFKGRFLQLKTQKATA